MTRLKRIIYFLVPTVLLIAVFVMDVVRTTVEVENAGLTAVREIAILASFLFFYLLIDTNRVLRTTAATKQIGKLLIVTASATLLTGVIQLLPGVGFSEFETSVVPQNSVTVFFSLIASIAVGVGSIVTLVTVRDLVLHKRKKGTRRNFIIYLVLLLGACIVLFPGMGTEGGLVGTALLILTIVMTVVNAFRQNWIVFLSRRGKIYCIIYSAFLFGIFVTLSLLLTNRTFLNKAVIFLSSSVERFIFLNMMGGAVYFGMAFISTLFHLPTAEAYERKQSELSSLHNLSRLVTEVFDFRDLVNTVTKMTSEVCGARSAWLELLEAPLKGEGKKTEVVALNNITREQIEAITSSPEFSLRQLVVNSRKVLVIDEVSADRRTRHVKQLGLPIGSLLSVPLLSHEELIGILHATKDIEFGFDQDDIDVVTAFADHVTIAIENSRLIAQSLERERYQQEMMVAQQMQRRLLPQHFPAYAEVEIAAVSEPSMEVGGDYFDFVRLDRERLGIVVGDVSGKGVSAAFYMAEVKGIFQSLSKLCESPRELLVRANATLMENLEKKAFISLIYAILDVPKGLLGLARAGHCPLIHISGDSTELVRPNGLGLGLTSGEIFEQSTEEKTIKLQRGDVCIFYTDGITESRNKEGEEFGYERLVDFAVGIYALSAEEIKDRILTEIKAYSGGGTLGDDMTVVVIKWLGVQEA